MTRRRPLPLLALAIAALVAVGVVSARAARAPRSRHRPTPAQVHCLSALLGHESPQAQAIAGSADPSVTAELAILRRPRTAADRLPTIPSIVTGLTYGGAATYDPAAAVRLRSLGPGIRLYAVPAALTGDQAPAACARVASPAQLAAYTQYRAATTGSGPGVCLLTIDQVTSGGPTNPLPGQRRRPQTTHLQAGGAQCESLVVLESYAGAVSAELDARLVPDGIAAQTEVFADGHRRTFPVSDNLATGVERPPGPGSHPTSLRLEIARALPAQVIETGPDGSPVSTLTPPAGFLRTNVAGARALLHLIAPSLLANGPSSSGSSEAACSARTHHCLAVVITTVCHAGLRCSIHRLIRRYRYVTRRPPRGTTHSPPLATAPIVARVHEIVGADAHPHLLLSSSGHPRAVVLEAVNCDAPRGGIGSLSAPLTLAVPSRTSIRLPHTAHGRCSVDVLVTSRARHAGIRARLVRR